MIDTIPKVILHEHIEGSINAQLSKRLAVRHGMTLDADFIVDDHYCYDHHDFLDFVRVYDQISTLVKTPEDYFLVVKDFLQRNAELGLIYCEFIASPFHFCGQQTTGGDVHFDADLYHQVVDAMEKAIEESRQQYGVETCLQMVGVRHLGATAMEKLAKFLLANPRDVVRGFNIAGDEKSGNFDDFAAVYPLINRCHLGCSFHAGEIRGPESVWSAIAVGAQRIGHGVRSIDDPHLLDELIAKRITLEVSLTSNYFLVNEFAGQWHHHPLRRLYDSGVRLCLNTDDAGIFATDIGKEYQLAYENFGFTRIELLDISLCALEASFAPDALKQALINHVYSEFDQQDIQALQHLLSTPISPALKKRLQERHQKLVL